MEQKHALYSKENHVALITLNRPEVMNATSHDMYQRMDDYLVMATEDDDVRAVVITGAGKAFCAGGDLKAAQEQRSNPIAVKREDMRWRFMHCLKIRAVPKPVIAAVNGAAAGSGCSIALACDIRIASELARFSIPFVRRGLLPDMGATYMLPKLVGVAKACELAFMGKPIDANEALRIGMVNMVVPVSEFEKTWKGFVQELATKSAPIPLKMAKIAIYQSLETDLAAAVEYEALAQVLAGETEDAREGARAFLEKREPKFQGK